jgi:ATP-binding cassette subfamily G (WHITE) protein 2 (SNQ2)
LLRRSLRSCRLLSLRPFSSLCCSRLYSCCEYFELSWSFDVYDVCSNGVLQPFNHLGWWQWMWVGFYLGTRTFWADGCNTGILCRRIRILRRACWLKVRRPFCFMWNVYWLTGISPALGRFPITCASAELVTLIPPVGQTCGTYLRAYIDRVGGYVQDPSATSSCHFCTFATTDQLLATNFHMFYSHRWRNVGFLAGYICVNVRTTSASVFFFFFFLYCRKLISG